MKTLIERNWFILLAQTVIFLCRLCNLSVNCLLWDNETNIGCWLLWWWRNHEQRKSIKLNCFFTKSHVLQIDQNENENMRNEESKKRLVLLCLSIQRKVYLLHTLKITFSVIFINIDLYPWYFYFGIIHLVTFSCSFLVMLIIK